MSSWIQQMRQTDLFMSVQLMAILIEQIFFLVKSKIMAFLNNTVTLWLTQNKICTCPSVLNNTLIAESLTLISSNGKRNHIMVADISINCTWRPVCKGLCWDTNGFGRFNEWNQKSKVWYSVGRCLQATHWLGDSNLNFSLTPTFSAGCTWKKSLSARR